MGNYATVATVQYRVNQANAGFTIGTAGTYPTSTAVDSWIEEYEADIDAVLSDCGYTMPATGTNDIARLRKLVSQRVAAEVLLVNSTDIEEYGEVARWIADWDKAFEKMQNCEFNLQDQADSVQSDRGISYLQVFDNSD